MSDSSILLLLFLSRHLACEENRIEDAKVLVHHGARLDIQNKQEKTPLELASPNTATILQNIVTAI
jgi:26S proteasome non-ATPase regulatory subunit 10